MNRKSQSTCYTMLLHMRGPDFRTSVQELKFHLGDDWVSRRLAPNMHRMLTVFSLQQLQMGLGSTF
jgi:hypothetical protein